MFLFTALTYAGHTTGNGTYVGTLITPATPNIRDKLCDAIDCVETEWNTFTALRLNRLKGFRQICLETGTTRSKGSSSGDGNDATINISLAALCDKNDAVATLLHEIAHATYTGMTSPVEHCRVWWVEYKYHRNQMAATAAGTPKSNYHTCWADTISRWYGNFQAQYDNAGGNDASAPPATPLPGPGACRDAMASIAPPGGGTRSVLYDSWGTNSIRCVSWDTQNSGPLQVAEFLFPAAFITDWRLHTLSDGAQAIVAVGTNAVGTDGALFSVVDSDGDKVPDTVTTIVDFGAGLTFPTAVEVLRSQTESESWYILDQGSGTILHAVDTNADALPDGLGSTFATSTAIPLIASAVSLGTVGSRDANGQPVGTDRLALSSQLALHDSEIRDSDWIAVLEDSTMDGMADRADLQTGSAWLDRTPTPVAGGRTDDQFILVAGVAGHLVEVYAVDPASGTPSALLGDGLIGTDERGCIQVAPLTKGTQYVLIDTDTATSSVIIEVEPKGVAQVHEMSPTVGAPTQSTVVSIRGYGLPKNTSQVRVRFGDQYGTVLQASETELLVASPVFGAGKLVDVDVVVEKNNGEMLALVPVMYHTLQD